MPSIDNAPHLRGRSLGVRHRHLQALGASLSMIDHQVYEKTREIVLVHYQ